MSICPQPDPDSRSQTHGLTNDWEFSLYGHRDYVRATDILRKFREEFPGQALTLKYVRPLTGMAALSETRPPRPCVEATLDGRKYYLSERIDRPKISPHTRIEPEPKVISFRLFNFFVFLFRDGDRLEDQLGSCFAITQPRTRKTFIVRRMSLFSGSDRATTMIWYRINYNRIHSTAKIRVRSVFRPLCDIDFLTKS